MTPSEEYRLWKFKHAEWAKWIAPKWAEMLSASTPERKRELWAWASEALRDELRSIKENRGLL